MSAILPPVSSDTAFNRRFNPSPPQILVLGFAAVIFAGAVLLSLPFSSAGGHYTSFVNALFTATSAVCVTGLVVVDTGTYWSPAGQIIILFLIQVGGLGFMTMATFFFLLLGKKIGLKTRMIMQASLNQNNLQGIVNLGKHVLIFTFAVEAFFALVLALRWSFDLGVAKALWYGLFHAVSGFNNAGFDLFGGFKSLTGYTGDIVVNLSITTLIILGGIGFGVVMDIVNFKEKRVLHTHTKLVLITTFILIAGGTLLFFLFEYHNTLATLSGGEKFLASYFQSVTPRTAGYNTLDIASLHSYTQLLIIILMFIGASPGSTGGGIKTTTFAILFFSILSISRVQAEATVLKRSIHQEQVIKAISLVLYAMVLIITVSTALLITENSRDYLITLFETVSAFGTVGLSMGLTPHLSDAGKLLIVLTMFLGRVGTMTLIMAFATNNNGAKIKYPKGNIMVG